MGRGACLVERKAQGPADEPRDLPDRAKGLLMGQGSARNDHKYNVHRTTLRWADYGMCSRVVRSSGVRAEERCKELFVLDLALAWK